MPPIFPIRRAAPSDLGAILGLIDDAAGWLRTMNTDQWSKPWPSLPERDARVLRGLLAGQTWLVEDNGVPVATVTYWPDGNHALWTDEERSDPAVYMSRLVINRAYAGKGVGAMLTDWAGGRGRREFGAETLRIDVWTTNTRLHGYYKSRGFHKVRNYEDDASYPSAALFAKPTGDIQAAPESLFWEVRALTGAPVAGAERASSESWSQYHRGQRTVRRCLSAARDRAHLRRLRQHAAISTCAHLVTLVVARLFSS